MKYIFSLVIIFLFPFAISKAQPAGGNEKLIIGADRLISEYSFLIKGKRIGLVTNESGRLSNGTALVDTLAALKDFKVTALFGPEHGIRGNVPAGETVSNSIDAKTGIVVYSIFGPNKKPSAEMLKNVDVLIYDIQDVGARFYTFISTLFYVVQAGAENRIPVIVLDRPNPIDGINVEGPIRKEDETSFVGIAPIPIRHGMTVGELARLYAGEKYIGKDLKSDLTVIEMKNWDRRFYLDHYSLPWINPSPNIPDLETAIVYPGTCLIEGTNVAEGRGTLHPFLTIGAPFINSEGLIAKIKSYGIAGVKLKPAEFTPVDIPKMTTNPKYKNEKCNGISIHIISRNKFNSVDFGIKLVCALHALYPDKFRFRDAGFDRLSGDKSIREKILAGESPAKIISSWQKELKDFLKIRNKYLLY
ncbi:MAG: exo-beta-N-acetylmuramidase NamZ family protein [Ignavibacteriaceae bacterium]